MRPAATSTISRGEAPDLISSAVSIASMRSSCEASAGARGRTSSSGIPSSCVTRMMVLGATLTAPLRTRFMVCALILRSCAISAALPPR